MKETIVTGRKFRRLADEAQNLWQRISFWTKASDLEFDDGKTAEAKVGSINGITSDVNCNNDDIASSIKPVHEIKSNLDQGIINDRIQLVIDDKGNLGWKKDGADTVIPFSKEETYIDISQDGIKSINFWMTKNNSNLNINSNYYTISYGKNAITCEVNVTDSNWSYYEDGRPWVRFVTKMPYDLTNHIYLIGSTRFNTNISSGMSLNLGINDILTTEAQSHLNEISGGSTDTIALKNWGNTFVWNIQNIEGEKYIYFDLLVGAINYGYEKPKSTLSINLRLI